MKFTEKEEAVSPVIGVILMVAITVILAAVIAVFVFGLADDLETSSQKDVTLQPSTNSTGYVEFTVFAGADVSKLDNITVTQEGMAPADNDSVDLKIGAVFSVPFKKDNGTIVATGNFNDGTAQILSKI
ncbi:flagellin-like protein [Methanomicrobium sp. W14]|uniref:type IV pilin n=1 Tax=Methanomicrobium sp. W14 TaxID=2817839 RepID=UPI001AE7EF6D|nr:type IV pilin N-terminal domain-containing protein [Methanomicrobium sp. W14]MBP2132228.1 flagellin-like protein [Methanomicrobium sp. W14]